MVLSEKVSVDLQEFWNRVMMRFKKRSEFKIFVRPEVLAVWEWLGPWEVHPNDHIVIVVQTSDPTPELNHLKFIICSKDADGKFEIHPESS